MSRSCLKLVGLALLVFTTGCATSVDMDAVNRRIDDNAARLAALEKGQAQEDKEADARAEEEIRALQEEVDVLRKDFADSKWALDSLTEKVESFEAYREEVEQFMIQFRKKGGEMDKALEEMTNRLEADVRSLAEKLKELLEQGTQ